MKDFIESIKISLQQLDLIQSKGLAEGLTNAILENISKLSLYKRPIHCTDIKRETLYIKHDNIWEKDKTKESIKKAIKDVANKNIRQIPEWTNLNPDCKQSDSKKNNQYLNIVMNAMSGGSNEEQNSNIDKIIKNITKTVIIEK